MQLQANMDPKHRDKVAFVRVCSGQLQSISSFHRCHRLLMVQSLKNVIGLWNFVPTFVAKGLTCFKDHQSKWTNVLFNVSFKVTIFHFSYLVLSQVTFWCMFAGQFTKGMKVQVARNGKTLTLTRPQKMFAQDRTTMETGYAGDGKQQKLNFCCCI